MMQHINGNYKPYIFDLKVVQVNEFETISLVMVTQNDEKYLEATFQSVFQQAYPALDYVVIDRDSTDGTQAVLDGYVDRLSHCESVSDKGYYDALQTGFSHSTGQIMGFLHSDSLHLPHTLATVNAIFHDLPQVEWVSSLRPMLWDESDEPLAVKSIAGFHKEAFMRGEYSSGLIRPEATFWRQSLWEKIGENWDFADDNDLWTRFFQHAELVGVRTILAGYREHDQTFIANSQGQFRQSIVPIVPRRLKRIAASVGITFRATNAVYDLSIASWRLRYDYI